MYQATVADFKYAYTVAAHLSRKYNLPYILAEEAAEVALIATCEARYTFDERRRCKFKTHQLHCIRGRFLHFLRDDISIIRLPAWTQERRNRERPLARQASTISVERLCDDDIGGEWYNQQHLNALAVCYEADIVEQITYAEIIKRAMECLTESQRQVICWRLQGVDWHIIAKRRGSTLRTTFSLYSQAVRRMRTYCERRGITSPIRN